jgi:4-amino-4-deoxy-L-arabinose transferase-like glycosyltransferase
MSEWRTQNASRTYAIALAILAVIAVVRVASTHRELSATLDEPAHLADGYEWLEGRYALDPAHPPLARVLGALPLRLAGVPATTRGNATERGGVLLHHGHYWTNLSRARWGNLLLLIVAVAAIALWAKDRVVGLLAVAIFTTLPPVLGHAGVLTTDLAVTAMLVVALVALERFLEEPTWRSALVLGVAVALGVLSKFSFLVFFPAAGLVLTGRGRLKPALRLAPVVFICAVFVVWGGYRFEVGKASGLSRDAVFLFHYAAPEPLIGAARWLAATNVPAPALALGLASLKFHDREGHEAYLLGEVRQHGWWYYFPVVFFYKTPLPFLILAMWGIRARPRLALMALAVLLVAMSGSINIGVRHVLPMYAPLSIVAAHGVVRIARQAKAPFSRAVLAALVVWLFGGIALAHPDYLAWFNGVAQPNPARIAVDSNLDWGQDAARLDRAARELGIDVLHVAVATTIPSSVPSIPLQPYVKTRGWVAVSETPLALHAEEYRWLSAYRPVRRVGTSIRLYFIP